MKCWSCQAEKDARPICDACGRISSPAPNADFFALFGLPRRHALDAAALERTFREYSLRLHPDRVGGLDARERRHALEQTTAVNEGYRTLKDPVRRAFYLLKLAGVDLEREEDPAVRQMPVDFLEEVMALREELGEAEARRDLATAQGMAQQVQQRQREALAAAIAALDALGESGGQALQVATLQLGRVRYFQRFLEQVEAMEEAAL